MRVLCVAVLISCLVLIGQVEALGELIENTCSEDAECLQKFGYVCLCMKIHRSAHGIGQCVCNVNPTKLDITCSYDEECQSKATESQYCMCSRSDLLSRGECICYNALLGLG